MTSGVRLAGGVHVEADCYLGQACTIRQNLRIGRRSLIGMGAVVLKDVPEESVMAGNPAPDGSGRISDWDGSGVGRSCGLRVAPGIWPATICHVIAYAGVAVLRCAAIAFSSGTRMFHARSSRPSRRITR